MENVRPIYLIDEYVLVLDLDDTHRHVDMEMVARTFKATNGPTERI